MHNVVEQKGISIWLDVDQSFELHQILFLQVVEDRTKLEEEDVLLKFRFKTEDKWSYRHPLALLTGKETFLNVFPFVWRKWDQLWVTWCLFGPRAYPQNIISNGIRIIEWFTDHQSRRVKFVRQQRQVERLDKIVDQFMERWSCLDSWRDFFDRQFDQNSIDQSYSGQSFNFLCIFRGQFLKERRISFRLKKKMTNEKNSSIFHSILRMFIFIRWTKGRKWCSKMINSFDGWTISSDTQMNSGLNWGHMSFLQFSMTIRAEEEEDELRQEH